MKPARLAGMMLSGCRQLLLLGIPVLVSGAAAGGSIMPLPVCAGESSDSTRDVPVDVSPGGNYASGLTLRIPTRGWSFKVPAQWHATVFEDSELPFLISDEGRSMGMLFPLSHATADDVETELGQPLALSQGLSFVPTGTLTRTESRLRRSYVSDATVGRALAVKGSSDQWIIYFLMGPAGESASYDAVLDRLADSTEFGVEGTESQPREGI